MTNPVSLTIEHRIRDRDPGRDQGPARRPLQQVGWHGFNQLRGIRNREDDRASDVGRHFLDHRFAKGARLLGSANHYRWLNGFDDRQQIGQFIRIRKLRALPGKFPLLRGQIRRVGKEQTLDVH